MDTSKKKGYLISGYTNLYFTLTQTFLVILHIITVTSQVPSNLLLLTIQVFSCQHF